MQYFISGGRINFLRLLHSDICHMTILHYESLHTINVFSHKLFLTTFTNFVCGRTTTTIKFHIQGFDSGKGWDLIANSRTKLILLHSWSYNPRCNSIFSLWHNFHMTVNNTNGAQMTYILSKVMINDVELSNGNFRRHSSTLNVGNSNIT